MFRVGGAQDGKVIDVLRLLQDSMDFDRHLAQYDQRNSI
jgi:hypothetical protein